VKGHTHSVNAAVSGISALPGTAQPYATIRGMSRFLNDDDIPFHALIEPAQDAIREQLAKSPTPFTLVVHDWCMFNFNKHKSKKDRLQRSHDKDLGYELGTALVVDAANGQPLGPMELRLRTGEGMLSTRVTETSLPSGNIDELLEAMNASRNWRLGKTLIHVIDREADSVGHYREWSAEGHRYLVRADDDRLVLWQGKECALKDVVRGLSLKFEDILDGSGNPRVMKIQAGTGRVRVAETEVVLHRPAKKTIHGEKTAGGSKKKIEVPGVPLKLRLVVTRVVNEVGKVIAEWCLLTNVSEAEASAAELGLWYAWRWRIETYHKLLKSSGMNAEEWQQKCGGAFLRRLCVVVMSCLLVWRLQEDVSEEASELRKILVRLSGRQMKHRVESTPPALLAGLEKLLALEDLMANHDLVEVLALARKVLPTLFGSG
jgi:hypothetical protein